MKIIHWGEDYAIIKIGSKEFETHIDFAKAVERELKREEKKKDKTN